MSGVITHLDVTKNVTFITLNNVPFNIKNIADIFSALSDANINIDMVSQTSGLKGSINISFTIADDDLFNAIHTLKAFKTNMPELRIEVNSNNTKLSLYGEAMRDTPGIFANSLKLLSDANLEVKMITTSEVDISYLIYSTDESLAVQVIKNYYRLEV